ncbi:MAG: bifunctional (p)ppGpp synthetase/guanosine-3',5'-bis(diphosphate) 3'-pyrophosphohydrolase [Deltaproteobacteria bacterium]|nr:MAG: bifunctional (p)ppGpp synthetase/guanosine-3',5'-bis(diphosphate) 3'-pyrophosphohydrolase [Deltaproteobacteria bacterium]
MTADAAPVSVAVTPSGPAAAADVHRGWSPQRSAGLVVDPEGARNMLESGAYIDDLVACVRRIQGDGADVSLVREAYALAEACHRNQVRKSGEPYLVHPLRVAKTIAELGLDTATVAASLLHDSVEDSDLSIYELGERLGKEVAAVVDGVTKLGKVPYLSRKEHQAESFRKMLLAMSQDIRVLVVKLADRLDNMRTLEHMPAAKRERISRETMDIYAPLAHRLGLEEIRLELEDISLRYLQPSAWQTMRQAVATFEDVLPARIDRALGTVSSLFDGRREGPDGLSWTIDRFGPVEFFATRRWPCQLHRMMQSTGHRPERPEDLFSIQVVTSDAVACYVALGLLHAHMKPVPGRFRDYVALPRPNGYRALHTVLLDDEGTRIEVQILSVEMDRVARFGILADASTGGLAERARAWLGTLVDWQESVRDPNEFIEAVKADLFADEVYVFSPKGDIYTFPKGATPIDFAFAIHTDVGLHSSGARVNGHLVPLRYRLRQGDTVEIITDPAAAPRPEWLKMCATARARTRIKAFLRQRERTRCRNLGRQLLAQELSAEGRSLDDVIEDGRLLEGARKIGLAGAKSADEVYEAVGAGTAAAVDVVRAMFPRQSAADNLLVRVFRRVTGRGTDRLGTSVVRPPDKPLVITRAALEGRGSEGPTLSLGACCAPVPGEPVVGLFQQGTGIVVHLRECPEALDHIDKRPIRLEWAPDLDVERAVTIEVRTMNRVGLLAEMSRVFSRHGANIKQANCRTLGDKEEDTAINTFHATVRTAAQLRDLLLDLKAIPGVEDAQRIVHVGSGRYPQP